MSYTDLTSTFVFKLLNSYQKGQTLVANDNYLYNMYRTYRRPGLIFVDGRYIDVENNVSSDPNATTIIFPDGDVRTVSEAVTPIINRFRRLDRLAAPSFSGVYDSGANNPGDNTWCAVYAVKTTDNASNFVLAAGATLPLQANFSSLNSSYGTNGWVYLGLIRNGDNFNSANGWLSFTQSGMYTLFTNTVGSNSGVAMTGVSLATASSTVSSLTYTRTSGSGASDIPNNVHLCRFGFSAGQVSAINARDSGNSITFFMQDVNGLIISANHVTVPADLGLRINPNGPEKMDIYLMAIVDEVLGVAGNPQL